MLCQYSTRGRVSSGKRDRALDPGAADGGDETSEVSTAPSSGAAPVRCPNYFQPSPVELTPHTCGERGRAGDGLSRTRVSIIWRQTSTK
jgi:hypothetical protein